jgi:hypothetical protein
MSHSPPGVQVSGFVQRGECVRERLLRGWFGRSAKSHTMGSPLHWKIDCTFLPRRRTDTALCIFYRRKKAHLGPAKATTATARELACLVYHLLKYKEQYREPDPATYQLKVQKTILAKILDVCCVGSLRPKGGISEL